MPKSKKLKKNQKGGFPFGRRRTGKTKKVKGKKANGPNEESPYLNPVRPLNNNTYAELGNVNIKKPNYLSGTSSGVNTSNVAIASNELKRRPFLPKKPEIPKSPKPVINLNNGPAFSDYNQRMFLNRNGNGNGTWTKNPYYKQYEYELEGNDTYYEAEQVPHTYEKMQNLELGNMPSPITKANIVTGTVGTLENPTELPTPAEQPVLTGPERPKNQIPKNPERLVKPSQVKRAKTEQKQRSLFNRHITPKQAAAPAAGGSRKNRTKKVRKTRK